MTFLILVMLLIEANFNLQINYIQMKITHLLLLCLAITCCTLSVVIVTSTTSTFITSPAGAYPLYSAYYNSLKKNLAGSGVQWITSSKATSPTKYQSRFATTCTGSSTIAITAATSFYIYLNGAYIGYGNNGSKIYNFSLKLYCGSNNLTIWVYTAAKTNSGLTFAINQDQSKCYKCQGSGYWNEYFCACSCKAQPCACKSPRVYTGYPVCGCACPSIFRLLDENPAVPAASDTKVGATSPLLDNIAKDLILFRRCPAGKYYSQGTCSCLCHVQYCLPGQSYDAVNCRCRYIIK